MSYCVKSLFKTMSKQLINSSFKNSLSIIEQDTYHRTRPVTYLYYLYETESFPNCTKQYHSETFGYLLINKLTRGYDTDSLHLNADKYHSELHLRSL